jgi:hypothetical protein
MNVKAEKLSIWCGPLAMAVLMAGMLIARLIPPPSPADDAAHIAAFYQEHAFDIRLGLVVAMFGAALWGPWIALCAKQIGRIEGRDSASGYCQLALGSLLVLETILPLMLLETAVFRENRSPEAILTLSDICWLMFVGLVFTFVIEVLLGALSILRDKRAEPLFPRWIAGFNITVAVVSAPGCLVFFHRSGPMAWDGWSSFWIPLTAFGLWMIVMTVYLLHAVDRPVEPDETGHRIDRIALEVAALREERDRR